MKKFIFDLIFKLPLIFLMLMALMFVGVSSVMALSDTMIVNQGGSCTDQECLYQNSIQSSVFLEETRSFYDFDIRWSALTMPQPGPTYHVGKSNSYMVLTL